MITNKAILAQKLSNGMVNVNNVSIRLQRTVQMWIARNEIKKVGNYIMMP